ncbi:MAG TPA: ABC transporter substrate-binding protein [Candidatus Acidoferrales bacterium]|nr:ABC transporter substrate-binding protein [Candidatus Acidoferrales bacterium]
MKSARAISATAAICAALCIATTSARFAVATAAQIPGPAETVVRNLIESIRKLHTTNDAAARAKLIASIDDSLAVDALAPQALGAQWGKLDRAKRDEFNHLMRDLLEKLAYPQASRFFASLVVQYGPEQARGAERVVSTSVKRPEGGAISLDYVLQRTLNRWQVVDIDLDGQSLAQSVAGQIQAVLKQGSYESLVAQMRARLKQQPNS